MFFRKPTLMAVYHLLHGLSYRVTALMAVILGCSVCFTGAALAQDPIIDRIDAANLRPGEAASLVANGKQLTGAMSLWTGAGVFRPKDGQDLAKDQPVVFEGELAANTIPGIYPVRVVTNHGCSEAAFVVIDDLPFVAAAAESQDRSAGQVVTLPCCINGQLNPVLSRFFRFTLTAGQTVSAEIFARRIGSELDPVLRVTGPDGREIAYRDDMPGAEGDTQLQLTAPVDGEYRIEVRDVRYSGGARHFFHLRLGKLDLLSSASPRVAQSGHKVSLIGTSGNVVGEATPQAMPEAAGSLVPVTFRAAEADAGMLAAVRMTNESAQAETEPNNVREHATTVASESHVLTGTLQTAGDVDWFRITVTEASPLLVTTYTRELSSPADILLELYNVDGGKMVENDDAGPHDAELTAQLPAAGDFFLKVSEIAGRGGPEWTYALDVFRGRKSVRVTAPVDRINVPRGGSAAMQLTVRRIHYDGPLKVEAVGLPAAISMAPFTIGAKQSTVPVVLTATDPAAASSDADWGPVSFHVTAPDGSIVAPAELQLAPPAPKKTDAEIFRSARLRSDLFTAVQPPPQFSMIADPATVTVVQGSTATVTIRSTRAADWTMPIEIALATPADQLPPGITVTGGSMAAGEIAVTITAAADAVAGPFTVFLQGKAKKDNVEPVHPVPPIVVEVTAK
jgi:hypothetical protein